MPQSENNANNVLFLQENKNSIMGKQWTFYPPSRGIGTLDYPPNLNKIIMILSSEINSSNICSPIKIPVILLTTVEYNIANSSHTFLFIFT